MVLKLFKNGFHLLPCKYSKKRWRLGLRPRPPPPHTHIAREIAFGACQSDTPGVRGANSHLRPGARNPRYATACTDPRYYRRVCVFSSRDSKFQVHHSMINSPLAINLCNLFDSYLSSISYPDEDRDLIETLIESINLTLVNS